MSEEKKIDGNVWKKRIVLISWIIFICMFIGLPLYIHAVKSDFLGFFGGMPSLAQLENPENDLSSTLLYSNGEEMGKYFRSNRSQVTYDELSPELITTLVVSEDHRFFTHSGLDLIAYLRVAKGLLLMNPAGGGSTISQQLAKKLYATRGQEMNGKIASLGSIPRLVVSKTKEWIIAVQLEETFTKEEIIAFGIAAIKPLSMIIYRQKNECYTEMYKIFSAIGDVLYFKKGIEGIDKFILKIIQC